MEITVGQQLHFIGDKNPSVCIEQVENKWGFKYYYFHNPDFDDHFSLTESEIKRLVKTNE